MFISQRITYYIGFEKCCWIVTIAMQQTITTINYLNQVEVVAP